MTDYYTFNYDGETGGPFTAEGALLTWNGILSGTAGTGFIVTVIDNGTTGKLAIALVSGTAPPDNDTVTQGGASALVNEPILLNSVLMLYPAYFREDVSIAASGALAWTGPALGTTHSFFFDGQTSNVVANEILTFSGGQTCEVITVESDAGVSGELSVRFISNLDEGLPVDNDTFTGDIAGDGTVNGVIHPRAYSPLELHRLLSDLNDDETIAGNDDLSIIDPTPSNRSTDEIVSLLGTIAITDTIAQHMYGGSISQDSDATLYSGLDVQVTSPNELTQPVLVQNDALITDYWKNAFMPNSIRGNIRLLIKTRVSGVNIDGRRVKGKLLEFGDSYFEGSTTLGTAATALALFSTTDGNNATAVGTVAGAPYNTIVVTEGYQLINYNNGAGAKPYGLSIDYGSANALQTYERTKYIQRRGTSESLFSRNAQLVTGINRNFAYNNETGGPFAEDEILAWGFEVVFTGQISGSFTIGEVITFSGGGKGRLLYQNDAGATGTAVLDLDPAIIPAGAETMTGVTSAITATVSTVVNNSNSGTGLLIALSDLSGAAGFFYYQALTGLNPANTQTLFGSTSDATADRNGAISTRTINNQFVGVFTGANFQTNFGVGIDETDAIVGDLFPDLLGGTQEPPNNQQGIVTSIVAGDYVTVYPWDGAATDVNGDAEPDFNQMTLSVALIAASSTTLEVTSGGIPGNIPAAGFLRVERDSDSNLDLIEYSSHDSDSVFALVGTAPSNAAIANTVMVAYVDKQTATTQESFTAVYSGSPQQVAITVRRGGATPIKTFKTTGSFGSTGFNISAIRQSDL